MTKEIRRVSFDEFAANVRTLLDEVAHDDDTILVEKTGHLFRVESADEGRSWEREYDPEAVRAMLKRTAGAFKNLDAEALKQDIRAARSQGSRGRPA